MQRRTLLQGALVASPLLAGLGGCASTAKSLPTPYAVSIRIDDGVNPDGRGRAAPILVKIFELKSSGNFEAADYFALQDRDHETLGTDLVGTDQAILRAGEERTFKREAALDSRAIGIIAGYRKLEEARWRIVLPLKEPKQTNLYKVWQFSPSEQAVAVVIRKSGIELLPSH
jgi:type VI secretion system protein VasD